MDTSSRDNGLPGAPRAEAQPGAGALEGAEPCNTAPDNYNGKLRVLRQGIDSLYLSYSGELSDNWRNQLLELKDKAQSDDMAVRALAQVKIGNHLFEVAERGGSRFYPLLLRDNAFSVNLSKGGSLPVAYIQVRSEYLAHSGLEKAVTECQFIVNTVAKRSERPLVSRADICVDYVPPCPMDGWDQRSWVTRAHVIRSHYVKHRFSGWSIGEGGSVVARIYDKVLEVATKSRALYLFDLWRERGMVDGDAVFRAEGQFRREFLKECRIHTPQDLGAHLGTLWRYFTQDWLRLTIPDADDTNQSRWPDHPFWAQLSEVQWDDDAIRLKRFRTVRIPRDERIFPSAFGYVASYMAREGITDFGEGLGTFVREMRAYMDIRGRSEGKSCDDLLGERIAAKGRLYNTIDNRLNDPDYLRALEQGVARYRRGKDGEDDDGALG